MAETQNSRQNVQAPETGQTVIVNAISGQDIVLEAAFDQAEVKMDGGNVVFEFANGGQVVLDFADLGEVQAPNVIMPDGTVLDMQEFLASLGEKDIEPAAGPEGGATGSGGVGEYPDDAGDLLGGVDKLGVLGPRGFSTVVVEGLEVSNSIPILLGPDGVLVEDEAIFPEGNNEDEGGVGFISGTIVDNVDWGADGFGGVNGFTVGGASFSAGSTVFWGQDGSFLGTSSVGGAASLLVNADGTYDFGLIDNMLLGQGVQGEQIDVLSTVQIIGADSSGDTVAVPLTLSVQDDVPVLLGQNSSPEEPIGDYDNGGEGQISALAARVALTSAVPAPGENGNALVDGLGGPRGFGENSFAANDDGSVAVDVSSVFPDGMNFFGAVYNQIFINNNGNITFKEPLGIYTPSAITGTTSNPMIAPFFADVDTRGADGNVSPGGNSTGSNLVWYDLDSANGVLTVTWDDVGYFSSASDKVNAFQLRIFDQGDGNFSFEFRYENVDWTTGSASGGSGGLGGTVARAGWTAGDGVNFYELPQSDNQVEMLGLETTSNPSTPMDGNWVFNVLGGVVSTGEGADIATVEDESIPDSIAGITNETDDNGVRSFVQNIRDNVSWGADGFGEVVEFHVQSETFAAEEMVFWAQDGSFLGAATEAPEGAAAYLLVKADGDYEFTLIDNMLMGNDPQRPGEQIDFLDTVEIVGADADGDTVTVNVTLNVQDDVPILTVGVNGQLAGRIAASLDETVGEADRYNDNDVSDDGNTDDALPALAQVTTEITGGLAALFTVGGDYGADGPGQTVGTLSFDGFPENPVVGLETTLSATDGGKVWLFLEDGVIVGRDSDIASETDKGDMVLAIRIVNTGTEADPIYQMETTQYEALEHFDTSKLDESISLHLAENGSIGLKYTVTRSDADGDVLTESAVLPLVSHSEDDTQDGATDFSYLSFDDDGPLVDVASTVTFTLTVQNLDKLSSAGFNNSFGYYVKDDNGDPASGKILWANVKNSDESSEIIQGYTPDQIGFFIIPDGFDKNASLPLSDGLEVYFEKDGAGNWQAKTLNGDNPLTGEHANVLFDVADFNQDDISHATDNGLPGNLNWEDILKGSPGFDNDYNDVNISFKWSSDILKLTTQDADTIGIDHPETTTIIEGQDSASASFAGLFEFTGDAGSDGEASSETTYALSVTADDSGLSIGGEPIVLATNPEGTEIIGSAGGEPVFSITLGEGGAITLTQFKQVDHFVEDADGDATNNSANLVSILDGRIALTASYTIVDGDGDIVTDSKAIDISGAFNFVDDVPTIGVQTVSILTESFENFAKNTGDGWEVVGKGGSTINGKWTVNDAGIEIQSGNVGGSTASDGLAHAELDTHGNGNTLTTLSTTVTLPSSEVTLTFDYLPRPGHETDSGMKVELGGISIEIKSDAFGNISFITDDGVDATQKPSVGDWTKITLDFSGLATGPGVALVVSGLGTANTLGAYLDNIKMYADQAVLTVDETTLLDDATADLRGFFAGEFGADGPGELTYALGLGDAYDPNTFNLVDTLSGEPVFLTVNDGQIEGRTATHLVFTVSLEDGTANVTLDQVRPVEHSDLTKANEPLNLEGMVKLTATITDADNDSASDSIDVKLVFHDDAPEANGAQNVVIANVASESVAHNLVLTVDVSGSMNTLVGDSGLSRLDIAKQGLVDMVKEYMKLGDVNVQLTVFNNGAASPFSGWISGQQFVDNLTNTSTADDYIKPSSNSATTNYESALSQTISNYLAVPAADRPSADTTVSYFVSDGIPTTEINDHSNEESGYLDSQYLNSWNSFIDNNVDVLKVYGVGVDASSSYLDAVASAANTPVSPIIIDSSTDLIDGLVDSVPSVDPVVATASLGIDIGADGWGAAQISEVAAMVDDSSARYVTAVAANGEKIFATSDGVRLEYIEDESGGLIAVKEGTTDAVFTVALNSADGAYTVTMLGNVDAHVVDVDVDNVNNPGWSDTPTSTTTGLTVITPAQNDVSGHVTFDTADSPGGYDSTGPEFTASTNGITFTLKTSADLDWYENERGNDFNDDVNWSNKGFGVDDAQTIDDWERLKFELSADGGVDVKFTSMEVKLAHLGYNETAAWDVVGTDHGDGSFSPSKQQATQWGNEDTNFNRTINLSHAGSTPEVIFTENETDTHGYRIDNGIKVNYTYDVQEVTKDTVVESYEKVVTETTGKVSTAYDVTLLFQLQATDGDGDPVTTDFHVTIDANNDGIMHSVSSDTAVGVVSTDTQTTTTTYIKTVEYYLDEGENKVLVDADEQQDGTIGVATGPVDDNVPDAFAVMTGDNADLMETVGSLIDPTDEDVMVAGDDQDYAMFGGGGDDILLGGEGNDFLVGNAGDDIMTGGAGHDSFEPANGADTITDFNDGIDSMLTSINPELP